MPSQPYLLRDGPAPVDLEAAAAVDASRERYRQRLREYLKDPAFRATEGFPLGSDEAILALSDPPYYTACPNPFLPEILEAWQHERLETRQRLGLPADDHAYARDPFATDVSEGKNHPIYNAHSYHTKVPHKAIMRYILHYTEPGDIVYDGFCGSGMTGVAAQLCGDRRAVEELGYYVDEDGYIYEKKPARPHKLPLPPEILQRCREMRQKATDAERLLWDLLRDRQVNGAKFRRQHPLAPYILDFYCQEAALAIELDGGGHAEELQRAADEERTAALTAQGIRVLRFWNSDVLQNTEGVVQVIWEATAASARPAPSSLTPALSRGERESLRPPSPGGRRAGVEGPDRCVLPPSSRDVSEGLRPPSPRGRREGDEGADTGESAPFSRLGARKSVLADLSPAATFIAYNYNTPVDAGAFEREAQRILAEVEAECGWMYDTWHPHCDHHQRIKGRINYTVWSDVFVCPHCAAEMVFWDVAVDIANGEVREAFPCPRCGATVTKRQLNRAWESVYDRALGQTVRQARQVPVLINCSVGKQRHEKKPDAEDLALIQRIEAADIPYWFPTERMPEGDESRRNDDIGITHVHQFFTRRSLWVLAALWNGCAGVRLHAALVGGFSVGVKMSRFRPALWFDGTSGPMKGLTSGTLYVPSFSGEQNWLSILDARKAAVTRLSRALGVGVQPSCSISTASSERMRLADGCLDYLFLDPPFGGNLMYSELSFLLESWLKVFTNNGPEAIINRVQGKGLPEYQRLMEDCFRQFHRVLKPGRWMTVEFHNSQNAVWNAIQEALLRAGFMIADVSTLDKQQGTFKQVTSTAAVKQDLIISAYKPNDGLEERFRLEAGTPQGAWAFVRQHLAHLPVAVEKDGALESVGERQAFLLFDRTVAFHIQRGATVPLSAAEFYAGLPQRFVERDGMYFLPDQVPEYDTARLRAGRVEQLALFVKDERSAIQWLRAQLDPATGGAPRTYQDIQPLFVQQLHQAAHEDLPELAVVLEQNFLQDGQGRWYVPDPNRATDLERLRLRALLHEFGHYAAQPGRLRVFRCEAIRAGFADAWRRRDYAAIVGVAQRLPEAVLMEDPELLMYYDNATLRAGGVAVV